MLRWTLLAGAASALVAPVVPRPRSARAAAAVAEKEDVELADCPVTQWGASIPDILAAQRRSARRPSSRSCTCSSRRRRTPTPSCGGWPTIGTR